MTNEEYWKYMASAQLTALKELEQEVIALLDQLDPLDLEKWLDQLPSIKEIWDMTKDD